jgi:hypothetical protein
MPSVMRATNATKRTPSADTPKGFPHRRYGLGEAIAAA